MSITYRIALEIPGEHREAPATFNDFDQGIAACVDYARQHSGVAVRMFVLVSDSKLAEDRPSRSVGSRRSRWLAP